MWGNQHVKILECRMTSLLISVGTDYRLLPADSATSCGDIIFALTQKVIVLSCTLEKYKSSNQSDKSAILTDGCNIPISRMMQKS